MCPTQENTHCRGKYHSTAGILFGWFGFSAFNTCKFKHIFLVTTSNRRLCCKFFSNYSQSCPIAVLQQVVNSLNGPLTSSIVAKFGRRHFGKYLKIFGNIFNVHLVLGKVFISLWHNLYAFGQIFIAVNGQILKTQSGHLVTLSSSTIADSVRKLLPSHIEVTRLNFRVPQSVQAEASLINI